MNTVRPPDESLAERVAELAAVNEALKRQIASRQLIEDDLRLREQQSREILDNLPSLISTYTATGSVDVINQRILEYTGKTHNELLKWGMSDLVHPDDLSRSIEAHRQGLASGDLWENSFRMRRHDDVYRWFDAVHLPLKDSEGRITRWCISLTDVHDRKEAEEAVRRQGREAREILDNIPILVSILGPNGDVQLISRRTIEYTGKSREELEKWGMTDLIHDDDRPAVIERFSSGLASGVQHNIVFRMRRHDGVYRWFEATQTPLKDEHGTTLRWCVAVNDIDDSKRLEDSLRESAQTARSTIDGIPGLVATLEATGAVASVNRQISEYTGCALDELKDWGTNGIVHPDDMPHVAEIFMKSIATGTPYLIEQRIRRFDGTYRWFDNRGLPIKDESGATTGWYVLMADIDDRRNAQDALRESEQHLRALVDGTPGFVASLTREGAVESANRRLLDFIGMPFEDLQNWGSNGIVYPDDLPHVGAAFMAAMATGQAYEYEHRLRRGDGVYRWVSDRGIPVLDDSGRVVRWYVLLSDIDDRKRMEQALLESERNARLVVDSIDGMIALFSPDGQLNGSNQQLLDYFRKPLDEVMRWATNGMTHPDDLQRCIDTFMASIASGYPYDFETRFLRHDGVYRWFQIRGRPLRNADGRILRWYGLLSDIDDRKRAEDALRESEHKHRLIVDSIPGSVAVLSPQGKVEYVNQRLLEYFGTSVPGLNEWLLEWESGAFAHPDDVPRVRAAFERAMALGEEFEVESRTRRFDGVYRWTQSMFSPLRDAQGTVISWYNLVVDIDDRKRAEESLADSERESRLVVDSIDAMIALFSPDGEMNGGNQQMLDYFQMPLVEVKNWATNGITHPDDLQYCIDSFMASVASGEPYDYETRLLRHDGVFRWFRILGRPLRNADGQIVRWYGLLSDIDDRKRAEAALVASESNLQLAIDTIPALAWSAQIDGAADFLNKHFRDYVGLPMEALVGAGWTASVHPDDLPGLYQAWLEVLASGVGRDVEARLRRHDGEYRWHLFRSNAARGEDGQVIKWFGINVDIEDGKRAEAALRESERYARLIADTIPSLVSVVKPTGEVEVINPQFADYTGTSHERLVEWQEKETIHPDDAVRVTPLYRACMKTGQPYEAEVRLRRADGEYRWFQVRGAPLRGSDGQIFRWYFVHTDIDDRKRAEAELRRSHDSFAAAQQLSKTGNFTADVMIDEHIWSDELYRIFGFELGKKISVHDVRGVLHPEDLPGFDAGFGRSAAEGVDFDQVFRIVTPDGTPKHLHANARVIERVENRPVFIGAIRDVTESRLAEEALNKTRAELAHVARVTALSTLSASIAHEVSQPLAGIITNASTSLRMLAADPPNIEGARETARRTMRDGNRAAEVITRLRALFSKKPTASETVDINEAARAVIALTSSELQRNRVDIEMDLADGLPPVTGDRVQLQQVILNLLLNASDALSGIKDGPRQVTIRTEEDGDKNVQLTVADSGPGIDPENVNKLFDAFYTTKETGMGIGLSVSRSIIEHHQGRIWASANDDGNGARFSVTLPTGRGRIPTSTHTVTAAPPQGGH